MLIIREFNLQDAIKVSSLVGYTIKISNATDYSQEIVRLLAEYYSPEKIFQLNLNKERVCFVAELEGEIVGTVALENAEIYTFFIHPDYQGQGIGKSLLEEIEAIARKQGIEKISLNSSVTAERFYSHNGYRKTGEIENAGGRQIVMEKALQ